MIEMKKNRYVYPKKEDYTKYFVYHHGKVITEGSKSEVLEATKTKSFMELRDKYPVETVIDEEAFKKHQKLWSDEERLIHEDWKKQLFKWYGFNGNDELNEIIYSRAWDKGHSSGHREVEMIFDDLSCFVSEVMSTLKEKK